MKEFLLAIHPTTGVLAILTAVWVFVEALNANASNQARLWLASIATLMLMLVTWIAGGYWYVTYYAIDKAIILKGPWPLAHTLVMETKEHLFFITLILCVLLPIVIKTNNIVTNRSARTLVLVVAALIVLSAFTMEGAGAIISMGVRVGLGQ